MDPNFSTASTPELRGAGARREFWSAAPKRPLQRFVGLRRDFVATVKKWEVDESMQLDDGRKLGYRTCGSPDGLPLGSISKCNTSLKVEDRLHKNLHADNASSLFRHFRVSDGKSRPAHPAGSTGDRYSSTHHSVSGLMSSASSPCRSAAAASFRFFRFCWWPLATQPPLVKLTGTPRTAAA